MSANYLQRMKEFLVKLVKDRSFQEKLEKSSIDEQRKVLQEAGYQFSKEEFETATIELLELKESMSNWEIILVTMAPMNG